MSLAAETRAAVRARPFLLEGLRAGVINYTAAARFLDVGETDAVAAALRRFADDLPPYADPADGRCRVTMERGFGTVDPADALLVVGDLSIGPDAGSLTALLATGDLTTRWMAAGLGRLVAADVTVVGAGFGADAGAVLVEKDDGPNALRALDGPT